MKNVIATIMEAPEESKLKFFIDIQSTEKDKIGFEFAYAEIWISPEGGNEQFRLSSWLNKDTQPDMTTIESTSSEAPKSPEIEKSR